jgi:hypothetical protein
MITDKDKVKQMKCRYCKKNNASAIIIWLQAHWKQLIVVLIICALGLFIINQWIAFNYKAQLLSEPCALCEKLGNICRAPINYGAVGEINISGLEFNP